MKSAAESNAFSRNYSLNINGRLLDLRTPRVMGILNITPDSFYGGSRFTSDAEIVQQAGKMLEEGASFIDIGGASTRPGAADISPDEEKKRVLPAIKSVKKHFPDAVISCDTFYSSVAEAAVSEGASMINDVSGGERDEKMFEVVAHLKVPYVLMHMRGTPETMKTLNQYENLQLEIITWLQAKLKQLHGYGVKDILIDPGFGFAKDIAQNFRLLNELDLFHVLEQPLLIGLSRKSMVWKTLNITPELALNGTTVLNSFGLMKGASVLRVHDVKEAVEAVKLYGALKNADSSLFDEKH
jgi:dihydropteroate synthase